MTEWDAAEYARRSSLQEAMAEEALAVLHVVGSERVLDVGCGDGKITAQIAARLRRGTVTGVDSSQDMIAFAYMSGAFTRKRTPGTSSLARHSLRSAQSVSSSGHGAYPRPKGRRSLRTSWIVTGALRPISRATKIPSSSIRWMSRLRAAK